MADIYRKQALKKITDPDQLDRAITVSSPMSWLAIIGIAVIFAAVIIWGFVGYIPETVTVTGVVASGEEAKKVIKDDSISGNTVLCYAPVGNAPKIKAAAAGKVGNSGPAAKIYTADNKPVCEAEIISVEDPVIKPADGNFFEKNWVMVVCRPVGSGAETFKTLSEGTGLQVKITMDTVRPIDKLFGGNG